MINIKKEIGIILRTHEKNKISYFSKNCSIQCPNHPSLNNGDTITNPYDIMNTFNKYFASIAETTKKESFK